MNSSEKNNQFM